MISLGLLYLNFKDAVCEGDGDRVLRIGNIFCLSGKLLGTAITLVRHLFPYSSTTYCSHRILLNNLSGLGLSMYIHNISCDLHMEHLNRLVKTAMEGLGANKANVKAMTRMGKAVGLLSHIMQSFDEETNVSQPSGKKSSQTD